MTTATATATPTPTRSPTAMNFNQTMARGRIELRERVNNIWHHIVMTPAEDEYSRPQVLEIRSSQKLGDKGDVVTQLCKLGGWRKTFQATDKETGERRTVVTADMVLIAVE